ncbi:MAG: zinc ribbon domain-containing protein [Lachnospiraceae bacterium]|nr:zinc ribbon domain-containing protein [Lachnospiraceae bacterium]
MATKLISVVCPNCGATLDMEEGRKQIFCSYCGSKVMLDNENEYVYRHIDEAGIKHAETERLVELKRMELAEKKREANEKRKATKIKISIILGVIAIATIGIGLTVSGLGGLALVGYFAIFALMFIWMGSDREKGEDDYAYDGKIKVPSGITGFDKKSYIAIESMFKSAGFTNVRCVPVYDLTTGFVKKPNMVSSITVNGEEILSGGRRVLPDAPVIISYHAFAGR